MCEKDDYSTIIDFGNEKENKRGVFSFVEDIDDLVPVLICYRTHGIMYVLVNSYVMIIN